jgi:hypothetical protein
MPRAEIVEAWRTGLALPNRDLEPTGRSFIGITFKTGRNQTAKPQPVTS